MSCCHILTLWIIEDMKTERRSRDLKRKSFFWSRALMMGKCQQLHKQQML